MALLRKCLNDLRTRGVPRESFAAVLAQAPDTVLPPPDTPYARRPRVFAGAAQAAHLAARVRANPPAWND